VRVLTTRRQELAERSPGTEAALRSARRTVYCTSSARRVRVVSGRLPGAFWDLPRPNDPEPP
jgi:hypothetical protein